MRIASRLLALACLVPLAAVAQEKVVKIGVLNDMSGLYADLSGSGSVEAAKMAAEEFGNKVAGMPIQVVGADHQNKPDIGSGIATKWYRRGRGGRHRRRAELGRVAGGGQDRGGQEQGRSSTPAPPPST